MGYFLGIDLGASALKAFMVDENGAPVNEARAAYATATPEHGHSEQNPADWRNALQTALAELRHANAEALKAVKAVSFSGGAHIAVLCDAQNTPLRPAIMWSDTRSQIQAAELETDGAVEHRAGNAPNPTWSLPQLIWINTHEPDIIARTEKLFFAKDWLAAQLTDTHKSDKTEAVGSLMAGRSGAWDETLIGLSGLKPDAMPSLIDIGATVGQITPAAAAEFGLPQVPVYQGAIDTSMEFLCAAPLNENTALLKLASAGVISFSTDRNNRFPPVSYYPHLIDGLAYHAAGMSDCMGAISFVQQNFTPHLDAAAFEAAAANAPAGAEGLLFYPYLSGARAPFWDASLTAELNGLTRGHGQNAMARAAYEGVGHVLTAIWHDMTEKLGYRPDALHILGGGGRSDFFCQMLADMLNIELKRPHQTDCAYATALFAAAHHQNRRPADMASQAYKAQEQFTPDKAVHDVYAASHEVFMARHK